MPDLPTLDAGGLAELSTMILTALAILWGVNKAVIMGKSHY